MPIVPVPLPNCYILFAFCFYPLVTSLRGCVDSLGILGSLTTHLLIAYHSIT